MLERLVFAIALFGASLVPATAHGPTPQKADESIAIPARPDQVWKLVGEFGAIATWHPLVKEAKATGGNAAGAERVLRLEKGEITEGLDEYDAEAHRISYRLSKENIEALPVSFYTATIEVLPAGDGSEVKWGARFYRGDTSNFPPDELNDEAAIAAMNDFIRQGLQGVKAKVGGQ